MSDLSRYTVLSRNEARVLTHRERSIVEMDREGYTPVEIANAWNLSDTRVRSILLQTKLRLAKQAVS